jgi:HEAT repeat protein/outer membrane protein assembly factor BamB
MQSTSTHLSPISALLFRASILFALLIGFKLFIAPQIKDTLVQPKIALLLDKRQNIDRRINAATDLGIVGGTQVISAYRSIVHDKSEDSYLREAVVERLKQLKDFRAQRALECPGLAEQKTRTQAEINQLVSDLCTTKDQASWNAIFNELRDTGDPVIIDLLIHQLHDAHPSIRAVAATALGKLNDERTGEALVKCLSDEDHAVYRAAKEGLGRTFTNPNILINFLAASDALIRKYTSLSLVDLGDPRCFNVLLDGTSDRHNTVRHNAWTVLLLKYPRRPEALRLALSALEDEERDVRILIIRYFEKSKYIPAIRAIASALEKEEQWVKKEHGQMGGVNLTLFEYLKKTLLNIGGNWQEARAVYIELLKSRSPIVRSTAAQVLGASKDPSVTDSLVNALCNSLKKPIGRYRIGTNTKSMYLDYEEDVQGICDALKVLDPSRQRTLPPLSERMKNENDEERIAAARALDHLHDIRTVDAFIAALRDADVEVRKTAAKALGNMKEKLAVEPLVAIIEKERLSDTNDRLSTFAEYACEALVKITGHNYRDDPRKWLEWLKHPVETSPAPRNEKKFPATLETPNPSRPKAAAATATSAPQLKKSQTATPHRAATIRDNSAIEKKAHATTSQVHPEDEFDQLVTMLGRDNISDNITAVQKLGRLKDPRAVEPLIKAFNDNKKNVVVRLHAATAMGDIGDRRATETLLASIHDYRVHDAVAESLGKLKDPSAIPAIIAMLKTSHKRVPFAKALGRIDPVLAIEVMYAAIKDDPARNYEWTIPLMLDLGEPAIEVFLELLNHPHERVRATAVHALADILDSPSDKNQLIIDRIIAIDAKGRGRGMKPDEQAAILQCTRAERAISFWAHLFSRVRGEMMPGIESAFDQWCLEHNFAEEAFLSALKDNDENVRIGAVAALGCMKSTRAVGQIVDFLGDRSSRMRMTAIRSLGKIKTPRATEPLIALAKDKQQSQDVRIAAIAALRMNIANAHVLTAIGELGRNQSESKEINSTTNPTSLPKESNEDRDRKLKRLVQMLRCDNVHDRIAAAEALGSLKDPRAVEPLAETLPTLYYPGADSQDCRLAYCVIVALGQIRNDRVVRPLVHFIETHGKRSREDLEREFDKLLKMLRSDNKQDRINAAFALARWKDPRAVEPLIEILPTLSFDSTGAPDCQLARRVVWALGELRDNRAVAPLVHLIKTNRNGSSDAIEALKNIGERTPKHAANFEKRIDKVAVQQCFNVLSDLGHIAKKPLLDFLDREDVNLRQYAVMALCGANFRKDPEVTDHLIQCLRDGGVYRMEAWHTLSIMRHLGDERIDEFLPDFLKRTNGEYLSKWNKSPSPFLYSPLNTIICRPLIALLNHEDERVRKGAVEVLRSQVFLESADAMIRNSDVIAVVHFKERTKYPGDRAWNAESLQTIKGKPNRNIVIRMPGNTFDVQKGRYLAFLERYKNHPYSPFGGSLWKYSLLKIENEKVLWTETVNRSKWAKTDVNAVIADISKALSEQTIHQRNTFPVVRHTATTEDGKIVASPVATDGNFLVRVIDKGFETRNLDGVLVWAYNGKTYVPGSIGRVCKNHIVIPSGKEILSRDLETGKVQWRFSPQRNAPRFNDAASAPPEQQRSNSAGEPLGTKGKITAGPNAVAVDSHWWWFASSVALDGDCIYVADEHAYVYRGSFCGTGSAGPSHLYCLDAATGKERWRVKIPTGVRNCPPSYDAENVYVVCEGHVACVAKAEPRLIWTKRNFAGAFASASYPSGKAIIVPEYRLQCLSIRDGSLLWKIEGSVHNYAGRLVDGVFYTALSYSETNHCFCAISADTGEILWQAYFPLEIAGEALCDEQSVYIKCVDRSLYCLDRKNGNIRWQYPLSAEKDGPSIPILTSEGVLLPLKNKIVCISQEGNGSQRGK